MIFSKSVESIPCYAQVRPKEQLLLQEAGKACEHTLIKYSKSPSTNWFCNQTLEKILFSFTNLKRCFILKATHFFTKNFTWKFYFKFSRAGNANIATAITGWKNRYVYTKPTCSYDCSFGCQDWETVNVLFSVSEESNAFCYNGR